MQQLPSTLDRESFNKLKLRLTAEKEELNSVREQLRELKKTEKLSSLEDPSSELHPLMAKEANLSRNTTELENYLSYIERNKKIIEIKSDSQIVGINDTVILHILDSDGDETTEEYKLVALEPDIKNCEISKASPIGSAILGQKIGETVTTVVKPSGLELKITILSKI